MGVYAKFQRSIEREEMLPNIAYSVAKLGGKVAFFTVGDNIARSVIETAFQKFGENAEILISEGIQGKTTSMELFENEGGDSKVNVMLSDVGDNADFGKARVNTENHMKILNRADAVIVANWASNLKGTELMKFAFESSPKALHFVDPADFQLRKEEFIEILALLSNLVDVLSINENECNTLGSSLGLGYFVTLAIVLKTRDRGRCAKAYLRKSE